MQVGLNRSSHATTPLLHTHRFTVIRWLPTVMKLEAIMPFIIECRECHKMFEVPKSTDTVPEHPAKGQEQDSALVACKGSNLPQSGT